MSLIKVAYFMLNFLNLKSKARHLFFWVASSLSMVWSRQNLVKYGCLNPKKPEEDQTISSFEDGTQLMYNTK